MAEEITMTPEMRAKIDDAKSLLTQFGNVVELRDQVKAQGDGIASLSEKLDRIEKDMMPVLASINKPPVAQTVAQNKDDEVKNRRDLAFKFMLKRSMNGEVTPEEREAYKLETRTLSVGGDSTGGLIVPQALVDEVVANVTEINPIRQLADVGPTTNGGNERLILRVTTKPTTAAVAELGTRSVGTDIAFGTLHIPVYERYAYLPVSYQMLEDTNLDLQGIIRGYVAEDFAEEESKDFVDGTGASEPEGLTVNSDISHTAAGEASTLTNGDCLIALTTAIKAQYRRNAVWLMNRTTWGVVLKLKGSDGQYLYRIALSDAYPSRLLGFPVHESVTFADIGAGTFPIMFGDLKAGYAIADHVNMQWMVDQQTGFTSGVTYFKARRRVGGAVKVAEALHKLEIAAS